MNDVWYRFFGAIENVPESIFVNVMDFGAVGDGDADDSEAIQAAIDEANSQGGVPVYFPPGTYMAQELNWKGGVGIFGAGMFTSVLKLNDSANSYLLASQVWVENSGFSGLAPFLRDISLDGNKANQSSPEPLLIVSTYKCTFQNLEVWNGKGDGVLLTPGSSDTTTANGCTQNVFFNCSIHENDGHGINAVDFTNLLADNTYLDNYFWSNALTNFRTERAAGDSFCGNECFGISTKHCDILGIASLKFENNRFDSSDLTGPITATLNGYGTNWGNGTIFGNVFVYLVSTDPLTHLELVSDGSGDYSLPVVGNSFNFAEIDDPDAVAISLTGFDPASVTLVGNTFFPENTDPTSTMIDQSAVLQERSADPDNPPEGKSIIWQSDGTGAGDDGDIMITITAGGVTKTATLVDFSAV